MYYCALGDISVVGSSPEALVKLNAGQAQLRPIAGTRPRSDDHAEDVAIFRSEVVQWRVTGSRLDNPPWSSPLARLLLKVIL